MQSQRLDKTWPSKMRNCLRQAIAAWIRSFQINPALWLGLILCLLPVLTFYPCYALFYAAQDCFLLPEQANSVHRAAQLAATFANIFLFSVVVSFSLGTPLIAYGFFKTRIGRFSSYAAETAWFAFCLVFSLLTGCLFSFVLMIILLVVDSPPWTTQYLREIAIVVALTTFIVMRRLCGQKIISQRHTVRTEPPARHW